MILFRSELTILLSFYLLFSIPIRIAFQNDFSIDSKNAVLICLDYVVDLYFLFLHSPVKLKNAVQPMDTSLLVTSRSKYLSQIIQWVLFAAFLPFEVFYWLAFHTYAPWFRVFKFVAIIDLKFAFTIQSLNTTASKYILQRAAAISMLWILFANFFGCLFFGVALHETRYNTDVTWLTVANYVEKNGDNLVLLRPRSYLYLMSIYWCVQTLTTVGYGDIVAHTDIETWICLTTFFIGATLTYFSLANVALLILGSDASYLYYLRKMGQFENYSSYRKLPLDIVRRVKSYYEHQWNQLSGIQESQVLAELPPNLQEQILQQVIRDRLKDVDAFRKLNLFVLNSLSGFAEIRAYGPSDVIIDNGSQISGLFIVCSGEVVVLGKITNVSQVLRQGQNFGINALSKSYASTSEVRAKSFCEIIFLSGSHYRYVMKGSLSTREYTALLKNNAERKDSVAITIDPNKPQLLSRSVASISRRAAIRGISAKHMQLSVVEYGWRQYFVEGAICVMFWDILKLSGVIFYSMSIPLLIGGMMRDGFLMAYRPLLICSYIFDAIFFIDIILSSTLIGFVSDGVVVVESKLIFKNFLATRNLVYIFLANVPIGLLLIPIFGIRIIPISRLLKLFHFHRFNTYSQNLQYFLSTVLRLNISFEFGRFVLLYCCLYLLCHWFGCIWLLVADVGPKVFHFPTNWKEVSGASYIAHVDYTFMNGWTDYFRAIYWALSGVTSIAFPDILSTNTLEYIVVTFVLYVGCQMLNALDSSIASLISNFNQDKREFQSKVDRAKEIIRFRKVSPEIEARILRYYEYSWSRYSGVNESSVLSSLPKSLRSAVTGYVVGRIVEEIPFFRDCSEPMIQMIISLLEPRTFLPNDPVVVFGEHGKEMFIIERGVVQVTSANREIVYATLKNGSYFGESCLLEVGKRTASAFAVGYCDTFVLSKENFIKAAETFPTEYQDIVDSIKNILIEKKKQNAAKNQESKKIIPTIKSISSDTDPESFLSNSLKTKLISSLIHPDSIHRRIWESSLFLCLIYYMGMIPLRIAFSIPGKFYAIDYAIDVLFGIDCFLNWTIFPIFSGGELLRSISELRKIYVKKRLVVDIVAMIPYDIFVLAFPSHLRPIAHAILRVPKLLRALWIPHYVKRIESACEELGINFSLFRVLELMGLVVIVGIYLGCIYYLLANLAHLGECVSTVDAEYGAACKYKNTWIQLQIFWRRLSPSAGTQLERFFLALNWAITTLNKETTACIMPGNAKESFYAFWVMFFGLSVNGTILGSAISLISDSNEETVDFHRKKDALELHISRVHAHVPVDLIVKCTNYLTYLTTKEGVYVQKQEAFVSELPHSLRVQLDSFLKTTPFLKTCPVFDSFSDEMLRGISSRMRMQMFAIGDRIINCGEMGKEMYFIDQGSVSVVSGDEKTVYTSIHSGGFFGETALFFKSPRTATIKALSNVCICYILEKVDLDAEISSYEFDIEATIMAFKKLQDSNSRRNAALSSNLKSLNTPGSKLSKVLGSSASNRDVDLPLLTRIRLAISPKSTFRTVWNVLGFLFMLYYAMTIPFNMAFLVGNDLESRIEKTLYVDFLIDAYWVVDIILKSFIFSYYGTKLSTLLVTDGESIWRRYLHRHFRIDMIASLPLEIFALIPGLPRITVFVLRFNHLFRLLQAGEYLERLEIRVFEVFGWLPRRSFLMLIKVVSVYLLITHWLCCILFMIHRYVDIHQELTFATVDHLATYDFVTGSHNVCDVSMIRCYSRTLYMVYGLITSVGYGDMMTYGNSEVVFEICIALIGSLIASMYSAYCGAYLQDVDAAGNFHFTSKLSLVSKYLSFRKLSSSLCDSVVEQYKFCWKKERSTGQSDGIFTDLTIPSHIDLKFEIYRDVVTSFPIFMNHQLSIRKRLACCLNPLVSLPNSVIYSTGDIGRSFFFVWKGKVKVTLSSDYANMDSFGYEALPLLRQKEDVHGCDYGPGDHFGEFCLLSSSGLRPNSAESQELTELYYINEEDLFSVLSFATWQDRKKLLFDLMTQVGGVVHTPAPFNPNTEDIESIKSFHQITLAILREIIDSASEQLHQFSMEDTPSFKFDLTAKSSFMGSSALLTLRPKASFSAQSLSKSGKDSSGAKDALNMSLEEVDDDESEPEEKSHEPVEETLKHRDSDLDIEGIERWNQTEVKSEVESVCISENDQEEEEREGEDRVEEISKNPTDMEDPKEEVRQSSRVLYNSFVNDP